MGRDGESYREREEGGKRRQDKWMKRGAEGQESAEPVAGCYKRSCWRVGEFGAGHEGEKC